MQIISWLSTNIFQQTAIFMGIIALIGLLVQKKAFEEIAEGTLLTITGYIIFSQGQSILCTALSAVNNILLPTVASEAGVYPLSDSVVSYAYGLDYIGSRIMTLFIVSWLLHIVIVKVFYKWFKVVYLTVHMMLNIVVLNALFWHGVMGFTGAAFYIPSIVLSTAYFTLSPMLVYKDCMELTDGAFGLGHLQQVGAWFGGKLAGLVGDPEKDNADNLELPGWLQMLNTSTVNVSVTMPITFLIIGVVVMIVHNGAAMEAVAEGTGGLNFVIWLLIQGFTFAAGVAVLLYGLRMFLGAIVPAFQGLSEKLLSGAVPALDCVSFFNYSPMGVMLSFLAYAVAGVVVCIGCAILHTKVFVLPSILLAFFDGGAVGVFANKHGGWKGCLLAGFVTGLMMHIGAGVLAPMLAGAMEQGMSYGNFDTNTIFTLIFWIVSKFR